MPEPLSSRLHQWRIEPRLRRPTGMSSRTGTSMTMSTLRPEVRYRRRGIRVHHPRRASGSSGTVSAKNSAHRKFNYRRSLYRPHNAGRTRGLHDAPQPSCSPNLGLQGQVVFVAIRDIATDEELTIDYAMTDNEPYEMECQCGSEEGRKLITGTDWQKPELQINYDWYFS